MEEEQYDGEEVCELRELDEATEWELPWDLLEPEDEGHDTLMATVPTGDVEPGEIEHIIDCLDGMNQEGVIADILVIVNTVDDDMICFTDITRNDIIMGRLATAQLNWWNTQRNLSNEAEGGDE